MALQVGNGQTDSLKVDLADIQRAAQPRNVPTAAPTRAPASTDTFTYLKRRSGWSLGTRESSPGATLPGPRKECAGPRLTWDFEGDGICGKLTSMSLLPSAWFLCPGLAVPLTLAAAAPAASTAGALKTAPAQEASTAARTPREFRLLTLNIQEDAKHGVDGIVEEIRRSRADIVGLQECGKVGPEIAKKLGYHFVQVGDDTIVLSKYELIPPSPGSKAVTVVIDREHKVSFMDLHTYYKPYQPYQLFGIPYEDGPFIHTEAEAIAESRKARGKEKDEAVEEIHRIEQTGMPVIVAGDLNEPSHLDWTEATAKAKRHPIKVSWPTTKVLDDAGLKDAYRELYPDEMSHPGYTWTPTTSPDDPKDHHDRLDYVLYKGTSLQAEKAEIVGESAEPERPGENPRADIVVTPYPTDHRGVVVTFKEE